MKQYCGKSKTIYCQWLNDEFYRGHEEANFCHFYEVDIVGGEKCPECKRDD